MWVLRKNVTSVEDVSFFFAMDMIRIPYEKSIHAMIQHLFSNPEDVCMLEGALCCSMEEKEKNKLEALSESAREVYEDKQKVLKTSFYKLVPVALQDPQFVDAIQQAEIGIKMRIERDTSFKKDLESGWPNYQRYLSTKKTTDGWACVIL